MDLMNLKEEYILDPPKETPRAIRDDMQGRAAENCKGQTMERGEFDVRVRGVNP